MASKTRVEGNRVFIDGIAYDVMPAGTDQYSVADEFGERLGYFRVRGKTITPEDYGLKDAPPVRVIGRLWASVHLTGDDKPPALATKGVCQISTHESPSEGDLESARAHRAWLKTQAGFKASYVVRDPATGKTLSIAIWHSRAQLDAAMAARPPEGASPMTATGVEIFPFVEEP